MDYPQIPNTKSAYKEIIRIIELFIEEPKLSTQSAE
jgi:hypothetical protein